MVGELSGGVLYMLWGGGVLMGFVWRRQCGLWTSSSWGRGRFCVMYCAEFLRTISWGGWKSHRSRASHALRMLCNLLLVLTRVLALFNGSMWYAIRGYEGGFQSPCLVLEPAHGGGNGSRSPCDEPQVRCSCLGRLSNQSWENCNPMEPWADFTVAHAMETIDEQQYV